MLESIQNWFANSGFMDQMSNEQLIEHITSPVGLGISIALIVLTILMKWRVSFVVLTGIVAGIYVVRYTITDTSGPNDTIFLFITGATVLGGFIIYFTLMKE